MPPSCAEQQKVPFSSLQSIHGSPWPRLELSPSWDKVRQSRKNPHPNWRWHLLLRVVSRQRSVTLSGSHGTVGSGAGAGVSRALDFILLLDNKGLMLERMHWTVQQSARSWLQWSSLGVHNCLPENKTPSLPVPALPGQFWCWARAVQLLF